MKIIFNIRQGGGRVWRACWTSQSTPTPLFDIKKIKKIKKDSQGEASEGT
jgi:hypothetical protein